MGSIRGIPAFVGVAIAFLFGIVVWSVRRVRASQASALMVDDWGTNMLVWLLVLSAFAAGAFISYALLRP